MARPLRILYEDAFYHVTAGGNEQKQIFLSHSDYETFLTYLTDALNYGSILHAFVLMPCSSDHPDPESESELIHAYPQ